MSNKVFELQLTVRDYELDTQGVVNNSVYQNYLEHARHEYLKSIGLNFNELHQNGTDAVVHKIELVYKKPLMGDDRFVVKTYAEQSGNVRFIFYQNIYKLPENELVLEGIVTGVFMKNGRPIRPPQEVIEAIQ
ncbi:acyl-CoA thioesterase [Rhodohalobacter halophilus]|uniref:acyl-CoA thioesterase n=1 Tax=Rhodohalobacter halophilus TaxID=1812810 RepID=UPI00083F9B5C|nr:thioesterase family protein [Rhodohalobacter halophilus]